jgi:hypothetical protein
LYQGTTLVRIVHLTKAVQFSSMSFLSWMFSSEVALWIIALGITGGLALALAPQLRNIRLAHIFFGSAWIWAFGCILREIMKSGMSLKTSIPLAFVLGGMIAVLALLSYYWVEQNRKEAAPPESGHGSLKINDQIKATPAPGIDAHVHKTVESLSHAPTTEPPALTAILRGIQRDQFLQELNRDLLQLIVFVRLNKSYSAQELGHFRILVQFKPGWWIRQQQQQGKSFWLAVRDGSVPWADGVIRQIGVVELAGVTGSKGPTYKQQGILDMTKNSTEVLGLGGAVPLMGLPIEKLGDLDQIQVEFFCNESLVPKIGSVEIQANTYLVSEVKADQLAERMKPPTYYWPLPLTPEELQSRWVRLSIKPDLKKPLPPGASGVIEERWLMDFHVTTPKKIVGEQTAPEPEQRGHTNSSPSSPKTPTSMRLKYSSTQIVEVMYGRPGYPGKLTLDNEGSMIQMGAANRESVTLILPTNPLLKVDTPKADEHYPTGGRLSAVFPAAGQPGMKISSAVMFSSTAGQEYTFDRLKCPMHIVKVGARSFRIMLQEVRDKSTETVKHYTYKFGISEE